MIILGGEQGSEEWLNNRLGIATASMFNCIITTKTLKRSKNSYIYELAAEAISGTSQSSFVGNEHTDRGHELEPVAAAYYAYLYDVELHEVGLCKMSIESLLGASPDRLISTDGGLEIKSPELKTHIKYLVADKVPDEYLHQIYGCLYITGRDYWDFMSYNELAEPLIVRTTKDDESYLKWLAAFKVISEEFLSEFKEILKKLEEV